MGRMQYEKRKLADIRPYENNPRENDGAVDDVAESIRQCSYVAPIIVDEDGVSEYDTEDFGDEQFRYQCPACGFRFN